MADITIEKLRAELTASIQLNAHDGVESIRLDAESVDCMVTAILGSIEKLGLGVVPLEPNMEIVKAGQNWIGWHGWKPMVSAVNLVPPAAPSLSNTGESE
jgi:hypothetical protein